jgi:hypothetical protein
VGTALATKTSADALVSVAIAAYIYATRYGTVLYGTVRFGMRIAYRLYVNSEDSRSICKTIYRKYEI